MKKNILEFNITHLRTDDIRKFISQLYDRRIGRDICLIMNKQYFYDLCRTIPIEFDGIPIRFLTEEEKNIIQ